jgi:uncharacterized protein YkwD
MHTHKLGKQAHRVARLLVAIGLAAAMSYATTSAAQADTISDEDQFVQLINRDRVAAGLPELKVHVALVDAARSWATKMRDTSDTLAASECVISHNPNLRNAVNAPWAKLGENVGCGDEVAKLHEAFMNSPKHRENVMDKDFDSIGIGIVTDRNGLLFVTEQFMNFDERRAAALASAATSTIPDALALKTPKVAGVSEVAAGQQNPSAAKKPPRKVSVKPRKAKSKTKAVAKTTKSVAVQPAVKPAAGPTT